MADVAATMVPTLVTGSAIDRTQIDRIVLRPSSNVQDTTMEGETVLLDLSSGRYYTLNQLGSVIWEHCTGHTILRDIHTVLCDRFDVAPERALDDLVNLVNELIQEGLLQQERR
jgi:hypothetical protein